MKLAQGLFWHIIAGGGKRPVGFRQKSAAAAIFERFAAICGHFSIVCRRVFFQFAYICLHNQGRQTILAMLLS